MGVVSVSLPVMSTDASQLAYMQQEVSLKKIIVEGYRAVGSLNTKMIAFSLRTFCCCGHW